MVEIIDGVRWYRCECGELVRYENDVTIDSSELEHECPYSEDIEEEQ
jgi:hypothetical protein